MEFPIKLGTDFSLVPDPTPAFLPWTETVPSSNPQEAATAHDAAHKTRSADDKWDVGRMTYGGIWSYEESGMLFAGRSMWST